MHPVARVSIKYWNNHRTQESIFSARFYCALLTLHVSAPFGGHLQEVRKQIEYIVTALDIFCVCEPPEDGRQTGLKHIV
jgi:hypothetical protein